MAASVTHTKVSTVPDGPDTDLVRPSDWNDDHAVTISAADVGAEPAGTVATHTGDTSAAHAASAVSADSTTLVGTGTDVQAVLEELDNGIADHIGDTSAAHAASAISADSTTLVGTGTDVQAVLEELDNSLAALVANAWLFTTFSKQGVVAVTTEGDSPPPHRVYNDSGRTLTFVAARATATAGPAGSAMTTDLNVDGTTIMTGTKVVIADGGNTVKQTTFSTATIADGHYLSMNVDAVGSGTAGSNLTVAVWVTG